MELRLEGQVDKPLRLRLAVEVQNRDDLTKLQKTLEVLSTLERAPLPPAYWGRKRQ